MCSDPIVLGAASILLGIAALLGLCPRFDERINGEIRRKNTPFKAFMIESVGIFVSIVSVWSIAIIWGL